MKTMTPDPLLSRITVDPDVSHGKPSVRGLRYPVELILELLSSGMSVDELLDDYDDLEREDIHAVVSTYFGWSNIKPQQSGFVVRFYRFLKVLRVTTRPTSQSCGLGCSGAAARASGHGYGGTSSKPRHG